MSTLQLVGGLKQGSKLTSSLDLLESSLVISDSRICSRSTIYVMLLQLLLYKLTFNCPGKIKSMLNCMVVSANPAKILISKLTLTCNHFRRQGCRRGFQSEKLLFFMNTMKIKSVVIFKKFSIRILYTVFVYSNFILFGMHLKQLYLY